MGEGVGEAGDVEDLEGVRVTGDAGEAADVGSTGSEGASNACQPGLAMRWPDLVMMRYSTPGKPEANRTLSSGLSTLKAVARAPASVARGATTVVLITASAGCPVLGSTIWEYQ